MNLAGPAPFPPGATNALILPFAFHSHLFLPSFPFFTHPFLQGVVLKVEEGTGSFVDVGLDRTALVEGAALRVNARVTLRLGDTPRVKFMEGYGESMLLGEASWVGL
jgi:hypothetical protein